MIRVLVRGEFAFRVLHKRSTARSHYALEISYHAVSRPMNTNQGISRIPGQDESSQVMEFDLYYKGVLAFEMVVKSLPGCPLLICSTIMAADSQQDQQ